MSELARLQDNIKNFSTAEARAMVEADLGGSIDDLFSEFSPQPIAAASLAQVCAVFWGATKAVRRGGRRVRTWRPTPTPPPLHLRTQVYRARVRATGQEVAVKVQRPGALSTISKVRKSGGAGGVMNSPHARRKAFVCVARSRTPSL